MGLSLKDIISGGVKGLGDTAKDIIKQVAENKLNKSEALLNIDKELNRHKEAMLDHAIKELQLDVEDRKSARTREADFIKATGHADYMQWVLVIFGCAAFGYMIYAVLNGEIPEKNREWVFHIFGIIEGAMLVNVYQYYFGSSQGSRLKDKTRTN